MMNKKMTIKKHNIIVIGCSALIAIIISLFQWQSNDPEHIESRVYKVNNGWGYDILVDERLFIRQESIPAIKAGQTFATKEQAEQTAQLVINKMKSGQPPALTKFDLEQIVRVNEMENGQHREHQ
jgi:hypothetical protein